MTELKLDDGFTEHPRVLALGPIPQRWAFLELLCYCARFRTDRMVPPELIGYNPRITRSFIDKAIEVGLLELDDDSGLYLPDSPIFGTGAAKDATAAERQRRWREAHRNGTR